MMGLLKKNLPPHEWAAISAWLRTFFPFQKDWILDPNRFSLLLKCRQSGASHSYAAWAVIRAMLGETTTVISKGEREGIEVVEKARLHAEILSALGSQWAKPIGKGVELKLASGGRVIALPATSGGRSFSGNVILDEFAYHADAQRVWDGAAGTVLHGFKLRVLSTPNGIGNLFHELWEDEQAHAGYTLHSITLDEAIAQGLKVDMSECWKMARGDQRVYDQLFNCKFLDNDQQFIPYELIQAAQVDVYCPDGDCYAGLDIGRTADRTSLEIVRIDEHGVAHRIYGDECKRTEFEDLDRLVAFALHKMKCRRVCVDSTGIGVFPAAQLQRRYGRLRVEPVTFTLNSKEELATTLYQKFADRAIRIPKDRKDLADDLASLRRIVTASGNIRYDCAQSAKGHGDRAWALALALFACSKPSSRRVEIRDHTDDEE